MSKGTNHAGLEIDLVDSGHIDVRMRPGRPMAHSSQKPTTDARTLLKKQGLRATAQRLAVLATLRDKRSPMSHDEVMVGLNSKNGRFDRASVWRVLTDLSGVGIVRRMDLGDRVWRYELHDGCHAVADEHPHFLCESCNEVTCLPPLELRSVDGTLPQKLQEATFRIRISGTCAKCSA